MIKIFLSAVGAPQAAAKRFVCALRVHAAIATGASSAGPRGIR